MSVTKDCRNNFYILWCHCLAHRLGYVCSRFIYSQDITMEALIAAVEKRQALYDKTDDNHSNRVYITKQWKEIGEELGMDDQTARKRWTTLRDYFNKSRKQLTTLKSGAAADKRKKWYLYDMMFLLRHLTDRKTCSNLSDSASDEEELNPPVSEESIPSVDASIPGPSRPPSLPDFPDMEESQSQTSRGGQEQGMNPSASRPSSRVSGKRKANFPQDCRESLDNDILEAIKKISDKSEKPEKEKDEDMLFFESLVPKMKHLDPLKKMECQAEIHMLVLRYVNDALAPQSSTRSDYRVREYTQPTHSQYDSDNTEPGGSYYHGGHYQSYTSQ